MKVLVSANPLCAFIPPSEYFFNFLFTYMSKHEALSQEDLALNTIQHEFPVIFKLLLNLKEKFPFNKFIRCLPLIKQKVFDPFFKDSCPSEVPDEEEDNLAFYPHLPKIRKRGSYVADKKGRICKEDMCKKFSKCHPHLLPGVFTMFCPHG